MIPSEAALKEALTWYESAGWESDDKSYRMGLILAEAYRQSSAKVKALEAVIKSLQYEIETDGPARQNLLAYKCAESARASYEERCNHYRESLTLIANPPAYVLLYQDFAMATARHALDCKKSCSSVALSLPGGGE